MSSIVRRAGSKLLRLIETLDPPSELNRMLVYGKEVAGATQLFARSDDGTVHQITPLPVPNTASDVLAFGNDSVSAAADTRFLDPWFSDRTAITTAIDLPAPRSGTLRNLFVRHNAANGNGNSIVYTVMLNGVATLLTVTLATGAIGQASDLINTVTVAQGDRIGLRAVKAVAIGNGTVATVVAVQYGS